jgi:hypothetical protein
MATPLLTSFVMLNLFQHPSSRSDRSVVAGAPLPIGRFEAENSVRADK